ncbi:MAG: anti-sigma factor [Acetobacteraceae bacterium]|nr:anti-sigma factor [Acetobacteraceae bacterium]
MTGPDPPIKEEELHAYVDGWLAPGRLEVVQRYLDATPEEARRVAAWSAQRDALRAAFASVPAEPLPPSLNLSGLIRQRLRRQSTAWRVAAAAVIALILGGSAGWFAHTAALQPSRAAQAMALLEQQAIASYTVFSVEKRHAIEVPAADRDHLVQWLSNRLERKVVPPDLEPNGYRLIGGRLLATERGRTAALFMYEDARGDRLGVVLRPMAQDLRATRTEVRHGPVNGWTWIGDGMGYAVLANMPDGNIEGIADRIRAEQEARG